MKIAVTGGNGRVGQAVIELALAQGHTIVSIDRTPARSQTGVIGLQLDTTEHAAVKNALKGSDALIHLAAIPGPGRHAPQVVHNNNIASSYNALLAAAELGIERICQASSINAIGGVYSRWPRYDYFPVNEAHPTYNEDPYSLSKWICELQADSIVRRFGNITIASLRIHGVVASRPEAFKWRGEVAARQLWGYTLRNAAAEAFLLGLTADFSGHECFYIVAPDSMMDEPSLALKEQFYPEVPLHGDLSGNASFFDCRKAERLLGWKHTPDHSAPLTI